MPKKTSRKKKARYNLLKLLGPGLITGASDDDPSGIATYSQVGAKFGFGMLWTMLVSYPMMVAVQEISARIGRVTGRGLAGNMRRFYSAWITLPLVALLVAANIFNLGADIIAMGTALALVIGGPAILYGVLFTIGSLTLQIFVPYTKYSNYLKWLTLALFAYVAAAFVIKVPWGQALRYTFLPTFSWDRESLMAIVAIFGTTISPYLFFWQASTEVEELETHQDEHPLKEAPEEAKEEFERIRVDTLIGMAASNIVAFFIILTTAVTLHANGKTDISSAAEAAESLRPLAGQFAFLLFSLGIIGTGLLAVPVLAGSAAYAVGEAFRWPTGLERKPWQAKRFYAVIAAAMLLSLLVDFVGLDPIKALVFSATINGIVAVPILILLMVMGRDSRIIGQFRISTVYNVLGWLTAAVMTLASIGLLTSMAR